LDRLVVSHDRRSEGGERLFIGVDGGGTGSRARIEDAAGRVLGTGKAGPAAASLGLDRAMAALTAASLAAAADAGLGSETLAEMHAGVGLAGVNRIGLLAQLRARPHPFRSVRFVDDATIACIGAHGGRDGGIVIVGTGSVGFAVVDGREIRAGGYGFPISDDGSGADLGLHAIRMALRAHDGRTAATGFTRAVMTHFADDPLQVIAWKDSATASDYATFAPLVIRHADAGDPVAQLIVREAAEQIDGLTRRLLDAGAPRVALLGGLALPIEPHLAPDLRRRLVPVEGDAVAGALHLARQAAMVVSC
jgi:glucosamine kinase